MNLNSLLSYSFLPCSSLSPLSTFKINHYIEGLHPYWKYELKTLSRVFSFLNYSEALTFVIALSDIAEKYNHHPEIHLEWGKVVVRLYTHRFHAVSFNDIILAAHCDRLYPMKSFSVCIQGMVQGVFFRKYTVEKATQLGVYGWVKNQSDGSVELLISGTLSQCESLIKWCYSGSPNSQVSSVTVKEKDGVCVNPLFEIL